MGKQSRGTLSRRESEVMDILYRRGSATVSEIMKDMPDEPTYSAVRSIVRVLADKGLVKHKAEGVRYVYSPVQRAETAQHSALSHLVSTFFGGSPELAATALLSMQDTETAEASLNRIRAAIRRSAKGESK